MRVPSGSGSEQGGGHDRDTVAVAVGMAAGGDDHRVGEVGAEALGEPAQVGSVSAIGGGGQLDLDGEQAPVLLDDQVDLAVVVPGSQMPYGRSGSLCVDPHAEGDQRLEQRPEQRTRAEPVDDDQATGRFLLTGSTDFLAVPTISESLAGRAAILRLWPMSAAEMNDTAGCGLGDWFEGRAPVGEASQLTRTDYLEMVCAGGYPEAVELNPPARRMWFESYAETVLSRDVAALADVRRAGALRAVLQLAAERTAGELNIADWCRRLAIDRGTLEAYLGWLRMVFLVHELPAWTRNLTARAVKRPKLHLADTGLAAALINVDPDALRPATAVATGTLLETFAANEAARQLSASGEPLHLHHYRDSAGHEVDLVIERADGAVVAVEIKGTASPGTDHLKHLAWMRDHLDAVSPDAFRAGVLLHTGPRSLKVGDRLYSAPIDTLWRPTATRHN